MSDRDEKLRPPFTPVQVDIGQIGLLPSYYIVKEIDDWLDTAVRVTSYEHTEAKNYNWHKPLKFDTHQAFLLNIEPIIEQTREERAIQLLRDIRNETFVVDESCDDIVTRTLALLKEVDSDK